MAAGIPFRGQVAIDKYSSLRKLGRAMRRGLVPDDRQVRIDMAMARAKERAALYLNSSPAKRAAIAKASTKS